MEKSPIAYDQKFVQKIMAKGGDSVRKCFQCATCSTVCKLSQPDSPFPRKEMILARWGQKEKLFSDPNIWFCHHCSDCSLHCPRGAKPSEVLAAVRNAMIEEFAAPKFLGRIVSEPKFLPLVILIPVIFLVVLLAALGNLRIPEGEVEFARFLPHLWLNISFSLLALLSALAALAGMVRFWKGMIANGEGEEGGNLIGAIKDTLFEVLKHDKFGDCEYNNTRYWGHLLMFYGFIGLLIVTAIVVVFAVLDMYPMSITHPVKIAGNIAGVALLAGAILMIFRRLGEDKEKTGSTYFDWLFLIDLFLVALTGFLTQVFRFMDAATIAYPAYFLHLVAIFILLIFLPYSKFAHLYYRFVAMVYMRYKGLVTEKN